MPGIPPKFFNVLGVTVVQVYWNPVLHAAMTLVVVRFAYSEKAQGTGRNDCSAKVRATFKSVLANNAASIFIPKIHLEANGGSPE